MSFWIHIAIIATALCGLLIAAYIHFKKNLHHPLVCPIGHSCDPVVHSKYSRFMDVPVELLGLIYYMLVVVSYTLTLAYPALSGSLLITILLYCSGGAFFFSLYLTAVQAFILKEWCTWCLISATLCALIFFFGLMLSPDAMGGLGSMIF